MTQSGWIAAALVGGFFVWLAIQGKLQAYWSILVGGSTGSSSATPAAPTPSIAPTPANPFPPIFDPKNSPGHFSVLPPNVSDPFSTPGFGGGL